LKLAPHPLGSQNTPVASERDPLGANLIRYRNPLQ
jgi:hypothetical protein